MVNPSKARYVLLIMLALMLSAVALTGTGPHAVVAAPPPPPTGVNGDIGPEWNGVTPTFVPYDPNCSGGDACGGQLVAFNIYTRMDANYLYVAAQALPAVGDQWNTALILGNSHLVNIYLNTIFPSTTLGSTILILPGGDDCTGLPGYENPNSTPNPTCNETNFGPAGSSVYYVATDGTPTVGNTPGQGGVAEMAISWTVLQNDPDHLGFPPVHCSVNVRLVQAFGNWFSGAQFGANRFGSFSAPNCKCHGAVGQGEFKGDKGNGNFNVHRYGCQSGQDSVDSTNRGDGRDFQSTQINSVQLDTIANTITMSGVGTSAGVPVSFTFVGLATSPTSPGWVSFSFSDGYTNAGLLTSGSIAIT